MKIIYLFIIISFFGGIDNYKLTKDKIPNFAINIEHYYSGEGEVIKWNITEKSLQINYNCDFENCKEKLLYSTTIDSTKAQLYFDKVKAMQLSKLNNIYDRESMKDGLMENISIKNIYNQEVEFYIHGKEVKLIKDLYKLTDSLLLSETKFKIIK